MKICAIICEFNPFHNGHKYLIEQAKAQSSCDKILCIMSGSFTQRGEICVLDKYTRARHAVLCGADAVIELPAAFAVAPAETFASGAIKILSSIPEVCTLAFGCESADGKDILHAAKTLLNESENFKKTLQNVLSDGESYIKSYQKAFETEGGNGSILSKPNNILGVEYAKAVLRSRANIELLPIKRVGAKYNDGEMKQNFSSASAIRQNFGSTLLRDNIPNCVFNDLKDFSTENRRFGEFVRLILTRTSAESLARIYGCGEGLENRLKNLENLSYDDIIVSATNKRYSTSRIKRILCANFLGLYQADCEEFLRNSLYLKPLAVKKSGADALLSALSKSDYPIIIRGRDKLKLDHTAQKCLNLDEFAYKQWQIIAKPYGNFTEEMITV